MANEVAITQIIKLINAEAAKNGLKPIGYRRYMQLAAEEIVPKPEKGMVDIIKALTCWMIYYRKLAGASGSLSLTDERTALTAIKKEREKLKLEEDRKNLVPRTEAVKWVSLLVVECKAALWNIPRRLGPVLSLISDERECEQVLRVEIRKGLDELAKGSKIKKDKGKR